MACSNTVKRMMPCEQLGNHERSFRKKGIAHHASFFDRVLTMMHISNPGIGEVEEGGSGIPVTLGYIVSPRSPWASSESGNR